MDEEDDLLALQLMIMANPKGPPVIKGTGGLRKLRFSAEDWDFGKSGGARVCYIYFEEFGIVFLVLAYPKNQKDDLSSDERSKIKALVTRLKAILDERNIIN